MFLLELRQKLVHLVCSHQLQLAYNVFKNKTGNVNFVAKDIDLANRMMKKYSVGKARAEFLQFAEKIGTNVVRTQTYTETR